MVAVSLSDMGQGDRDGGHFKHASTNGHEPEQLERCSNGKSESGELADGA